MWRRDSKTHVAPTSGTQFILCGFIGIRDCLTTSESLQINIYHQQKQFRMKKIKWIIITAAVSFSIVSAFAFRSKPLQTGLYYYHAGYFPVSGVMGRDWICESSTSVCTYTKSGQTYTPYNTVSTYVSLGVTTPTPDPKSAQKKKE
jgi:hypothetical protein